MVLSVVLELLVTVPMLDMLDMLVLDTLDMLTMLWLLLLLTLVLLLLLPSTPALFLTHLCMDMLDTTMASVKLKLTLMPMPTPLDRLLLGSPSTTPMLLDTPTMWSLGLEQPTLPLSTMDTLLMLLPPTLDMLDILAMLVLDMLVLAILELTMDK